VTGRWTVVIPVKAATRSKTRLAPHIGDEARAALAAAFAADTIAAASAAAAVHRVLVVGEDAELAAGAEFVDERAMVGKGRGLTRSIALGIARARAGGSVDVAVLLGDLPSLRPEDLDAALALAAEHPLAFVADADGTGSTFAAGRAGEPFAPRFGPHSAREHRRAGFEPIEAAPRLRRDVDTLAALEDAIALGTGPNTAHVVALLADARKPGADVRGL
jgi:2-phospho-L-lactate guanylyltransferase